MITASEARWIGPFTGLSPQQFGTLITALRVKETARARKGRPWGLPLEDRVLLVIAYWRTNLTLRQLAPLFGISKSAAARIVDHLGPALALRQRQRFRKDAVLIVDGTLVPTRDHSIAERSPGRHRRRHPACRRRRPTPARQPQRLQGMGAVRREGHRRQDNGDR